MEGCESQMKRYVIEDKYRYMAVSTTKGTQEKYKKDGYYYKVDGSGNEGFCEFLASLVLVNSDLPASYYTVYEECIINEKQGCRSADFLRNENEEFITISTMYGRLSGKSNYADYLMGLGTPEKRLQSILDVAEGYGIDRAEYRDYLRIMLQFDMLILNTDRHVHNFGVIYDQEAGVCRLAPIFDNGRSLHTVPGTDDVSCTISGSFEQQVTVFEHPVKAAFRIEYDKLLPEIDDFSDRPEAQILKEQLKRYEGLFKQTLI